MNLRSREEGPLTVRIDQWLWAVRVCKTRIIAADLCKRQRVVIDGQGVKASRKISIGLTVTVKKDGIERKYKILKAIAKRVGAKSAAECCQELTEQAQLDKLAAVQSGWTPRRGKGEGRPTKKERRALDHFLDK